MLMQRFEQHGRSSGRQASAPRGRMRALGGLALVTAATLISVSVAQAGDREQARRIHDRLAGVPPTEAVLDLMTATDKGDVADAEGREVTVRKLWVWPPGE